MLASPEDKCLRASRGRFSGLFCSSLLRTFLDLQLVQLSQSITFRTVAAFTARSIDMQQAESCTGRCFPAATRWHGSKAHRAYPSGFGHDAAEALPTRDSRTDSRTMLLRNVTRRYAAVDRCATSAAETGARNARGSQRRA